MTTERVFRVGRVGQLGDFLEYLSSVGLLKPATAQSYKTAAGRVLATAKQLLPNYERVFTATDIRELDVEECVEVFRSSKSGLTDETMSSYQTRFRRAVDLYRQWLDDPEGMQGPPTRDNVALNLGRGRFETKEGVFAFRNTGEAIAAALRDTGPEGLVPYQVPLADKRTIFLLLPFPLATEDAERISQFVHTLAIDPPATDPGEPSLAEHREPSGAAGYPFGGPGR